jgi:hypothetical protein
MQNPNKKEYSFAGRLPSNNVFQTATFYLETT